MLPYAAFIWVFTVCQSTCLLASRMNRVKTLGKQGRLSQAISVILKFRREWILPYINWAATRENLSSGFPTKWDSNQRAKLKRLARIVKFPSWQDLIWYFPISEGADQTGLRRLVCAFVVRKPRRQVFSRRGPFKLAHENLALLHQRAAKAQTRLPIEYPNLNN